MQIGSNQLTEVEQHAFDTATAWARQSIAFAMSLRDTDTKGQVEDDESIHWMLVEADHLTNDLWESCLTTCPDNAALPTLLTAYSRNIFDWCYKHMHYETGKCD